MRHRFFSPPLCRYWVSQNVRKKLRKNPNKLFGHLNIYYLICGHGTYIETNSPLTLKWPGGSPPERLSFVFVHVPGRVVTLILVRATLPPEFLRAAPISHVLLIFGFKNIVQVRHLVKTWKFPSKNKHLQYLVTNWLL